MTSIARLTSGSHYTPIVAGDINGDGSSRNDRAFMFNPATAPDTAVANAMTRLLASTSGNARQCLEAQLGTIAGRNTCTGPWQPSLDFQLNWRPALFARRLALSIQTINVLGGLDQWINGPDNLKGWGGNTRPDNTLLTVTGFDPATDQFRYVVNERFGNTSSSATAIRQPFQLALNLRYAIGYDPRTLQIQGLGRGNGRRSPAELVDSFMVRFRRENPATAALARKDSLALSPQQITQLQAVVDSSNRRMKPAIDSLTAAVATVQASGSSANVIPLLARIRPVMQQTVQEQRRLVAAVQKILTSAQWGLLPAEVRNPTGNLFGGGRGGFGGRGGGRGGGE